MEAKKHRYYLHEYDPNVEYPEGTVFVKRDERNLEDWDGMLKRIDEKVKRLKEEREK